MPDDSASATQGWLAIGEIVGAFGIAGELKVSPLTDFPERFRPGAIVTVGSEHHRYTISRARAQRHLLIVALEGLADLAAAERLRGQRIWIPEAERTPLPPDQYYLHEVVGLRVETLEGQPLGHISEVISGGQDLFVVRTPGGREVLLPAVKAFVRQVDLAGGVVRVAPIPGLFDDAGASGAE